MQSSHFFKQHQVREKQEACDNLGQSADTLEDSIFDELKAIFEKALTEQNVGEFPANSQQEACDYLEQLVDTLVDGNFDKIKTILVEKGLTEKEAVKVLEKSKQEVKVRTVTNFLKKVEELNQEATLTKC